MTSAERKFWSTESQLRQLLGRQLGLVTTQQWLELGLGYSALTRAVQRGDFERIFPHVMRSTFAATDFRQSALAAVLWAGDDAVASHSTAARLWGIALPDPALHVLVPRNRRPRTKGVTVHRGELDLRDRRLRDGIPLTSASRTLLDCASLLDDEDLEAAMEDFLRRGLTTPMAIGRSLDGKGTGTPGSQRLRDLIESRDGAALEYRLEVKLWRLLRSAGLRPVRQFKVQCEGRGYRLDFAWPILKVAVEGDGYSAHGGRRAFVQDRRRLSDLAAAGWLVIPITWDECVHAPDNVIRKISRALTQAA